MKLPSSVMIPPYLRNRRYMYLSLGAFLIFLSILSLKSDLRENLPGFRSPPQEPSPPPPPPPHPIYKPARETPNPIVDNFPVAAAATSAADLPPIPAWNQPPTPHVPESTPLFIGFTRNWLLLQQTVVSYLTAGWPASDIYVIENTGTMDANKNGRLTLQNPFYLDWNRLTNIFGVNIISTPTLLSFSQLQNFYIYTALERNWTHYYWGHMDVAALAQEDWLDPATNTYSSLYMRCVADLRATLDPSYAVDEDGRLQRWALKFYAYDRLTLVNRKAYEEVGGWDTQIPYYGTDCDMHERMTMAGLRQDEVMVGLIYDLASALDDLLVLYRRKSPVQAQEYTAAGPATRRQTLEDMDDAHTKFGPEDERASEAWFELTRTLDAMQNAKNSDERGRNIWQGIQAGGQGEPYYKDPEGFEIALQMTIEHGRNVMAEKWGHRGCDIRGVGLGPGDEWRVEHDWDRPPEGD